MKKRTIAGLLCVLSICLLFGVTTGCKQSGRKIAFFQYKKDDTFISEMMKYMTQKVDKDETFRGVTYVVCDAGNSQLVQNQQILELISEGYDLFVVNAVDRLASNTIVEKCAREGIPVIFFNREPLKDALTPDNAGYKAYYVGADADSLGVEQAKMVAVLFTDRFAYSKFDKNNDGKVQLVILKGEQGHQDAEKRTENCVSKLRELGYTVEVLGIELADWNRQDGYEAMKRFYKQYGDTIELVFSNNDDMAVGAIDYLINEEVFFENKSITEQPFVVVGVDGTAVGLKYIEKGLLYGTVKNDSVKQADDILALVDCILNGKDFDDFPEHPNMGSNEPYTIYIKGEIITLANLKDYLN